MSRKNKPLRSTGPGQHATRRASIVTLNKAGPGRPCPCRMRRGPARSGNKRENSTNRTSALKPQLLFENFAVGAFHLPDLFFGFPRKI